MLVVIQFRKYYCSVTFQSTRDHLQDLLCYWKTRCVTLRREHNELLMLEISAQRYIWT
jgi:hypothetical protein